MDFLLVVINLQVLEQSISFFLLHALVLNFFSKLQKITIPQKNGSFPDTLKRIITFLATPFCIVLPQLLSFEQGATDNYSCYALLLPCCGLDYGRLLACLCFLFHVFME